MNIILGLGGTGYTGLECMLQRNRELRGRNIGTMVSIAVEREKHIRAFTQKLFEELDFACELQRVLIALEDDETKARRIEKEFFADIQKLYGYHACMEGKIHQLPDHETGKVFKPVKIIWTGSVKLDAVCNQAQRLEYPMPAKNESRFRFIRKKETCSKGEVRLKPPLRCILELLLQTLERTLKILEEKIQKQWEEWRYPQNRVRKIWTEPYQESIRKLQRYRNNKIHPEALNKFQYRSRDLIIA